MENLILYIGRDCDLEKDNNYFDMLQKEFLIHKLSLEKVANMQEALLSLSKQDYLLVIIMEDYVNFMPQLHIMRDLKPTPIIIMSTVYEADTAIEALNRGADSYIQQPNTTQEVYACSNALIRRFKELSDKKTQQITMLVYEHFTLYPEHRKLFVSEQEIYLTRKEFDLFHLLLENRGRVLRYEQIFDKVWGEECYDGTTNALSVLISRIRQKLNLENLRNVHDLGYTLDVQILRVNLAR